MPCWSAAVLRRRATVTTSSLKNGVSTEFGRSCGVRITSLTPTTRCSSYRAWGGGDYLHHDFVNFDVIARFNTATFKEQLCGRTGHRMAEVHIVSDDACVEKIPKTNLSSM